MGDVIEMFIDSARVGELEHVRALLEGGSVYVNTPNYNGVCAISFSVSRGHFDVTRLLIDAGADLSLRDADGDTPLFNAVMRFAKRNVRVPHAQATAEIFEMVRLLIDSGADVNSLSGNGSTLLMSGISNRCPLEVLKLFIDKIDSGPVNQSTLNATDTRGKSALSIAIATRNIDCLELLLLAGVDTEINLGGRQMTATVWAEYCESLVRNPLLYSDRMSSLLRDVAKEFSYKCNQRVFAMGGHRKTDSIVQLLNSEILKLMFRRDTTHLTTREALIDAITTKQLKIHISNSRVADDVY